MRILGVNAVFHDPAAALVVDAHVVAAAEEGRSSRREHDERPVLPSSELDLGDPGDAIRTDHARRTPGALATASPGLDREEVRFVPHHLAPAASVQEALERAPRVAALLRAFEQRTGLPVVVHTSLNTGGRPVVEDPRDALELFGAAPVDVLVLGAHLVRRAALAQDGA